MASNSPVCDLFIFVSSKMQVKTRPLRLSSACWYLRITTNLPAFSHSEPPKTQWVMMPKCSSNAWTAVISLLCLMRVCHIFFSVVQVKSWAPGAVLVNVAVATTRVALLLVRDVALLTGLITHSLAWRLISSDSIPSAGSLLLALSSTPAGIPSPPSASPQKCLLWGYPCQAWCIQGFFVSLRKFQEPGYNYWVRMLLEAELGTAK